jgi:hypothetical protein
LRSKRILLAAIIGLNILSLLLVIIGVQGFLQWAFMELYFGQYLPPELIEILPTFSLAQLHDIGILLSSVGLVILYLPVTLTLVIGQKTEPPSSQIKSRLVHFLSYSDFFKILGFLGLFLASTGVWFCMHQAFLYQGEYLKGTLPSNIYNFLLFEISPLALHVVGNLFVTYGLTTIILISAIKVIFGFLAQLGMLK